jgi:hypothetical protein
MGLGCKETGMERSELKEALRKEMAGDWESLLEEVSRSVQEARPGRVIAESEEAVRDAAAQFRERLYQKAIALRVQAAGPAFSPSGGRGGKGMASQRPPAGDVLDGERAGGD